MRGDGQRHCVEDGWAAVSDRTKVGCQAAQHGTAKHDTVPMCPLARPQAAITVSMLNIMLTSSCSPFVSTP